MIVVVGFVGWFICDSEIELVFGGIVEIVIVFVGVVDVFVLVVDVWLVGGDVVMVGIYYC